MSKSGKSLILGLLEPNPDKRLTALQALDHKWILGANDDETAANLLDSEVIDAMQSFHRKSAFQRAAAMIMVQCLSPAEIGRLEKMFVAIDQTHEVRCSLR